MVEQRKVKAPGFESITMTLEQESAGWAIYVEGPLGRDYHVKGKSEEFARSFFNDLTTNGWGVYNLD